MFILTAATRTNLLTFVSFANFFLNFQAPGGADEDTNWIDLGEDFSPPAYAVSSLGSVFIAYFLLRGDLTWWCVLLPWLMDRTGC